jgi:endonuclease YncB( thermonuclease family)
MRMLFLFAVAAASFAAGGLFWDDALFNMPRYCVTGIKVVDGDTIRCEGRTIRLAGFDTPESRPQNTSCAEGEVPLGKIATCTLRHLVDTGKTTFVRPSGRRDDSHGRRPLADLIVDGHNVRDTLIAQGLARPYEDGENKPAWCELIKAWPELLEKTCPQSAP